MWIRCGFFMRASWWSWRGARCWRGWRVAHGAMSVGTLVAFITLVSMLIWPVRQMGRILSELGKAMVALGRIQEILSVPEESSAEKPADGLPDRAKGEIAIRELSF